jgi:hypothetical protein
MTSARIGSALLAFALLFTTAGAATAQPGTAQAATILVLTVVSPDSSTRSAVLECYPSVSGSHPDAASACQELGAVGGAFDSLSADPQSACPAVYAPVSASASGVWCGRQVSWQRTFGNSCVLRTTTGSVFAF